MLPSFSQLKFALRSLLRQPGYLALNLTGFGIGIACAFVALLYAWQEFNYDRDFRGGERVYRVGIGFMNMGGFANGPEQLVPQLLADCPAVEYGTRFKKYSTETVTVHNQTFSEPWVLYIDSVFFRMFDYPFLEGTAEQAMTGPDQVVLSKALAIKYFGNQPAVGQTLHAGEDGRLYEVVGVVGEKAHQSHLDGSMWLSIYPKIRNAPKAEWFSAAFYNYVRMRPGTGANELTQALDRITRTQIHPMYAADQSYDDWIKSDNGIKWYVDPLRDIHLRSSLNFEVNGSGDAEKVYGLLLIGFFILLIAIVNYINLVTARASLRAKEVGIRKTLGIGNAGLFRYFLTESALFGIGAALVGLFVSNGLLELATYITGNQLIDLARYRTEQIIGISAFALLVSIVAGVYPALFMTRFRPSAVLKGQWSVQGNRRLRSGLVIGQFAIAVMLIIGSFGIYRQLQFMQHRDWGFERAGICVIKFVDHLGEKAEVFRQEIARQSGVAGACITGSMPNGHTMFFKTYKTPAMDKEMPLKSFMVDADYVPILGLHLLSGRNFDKSMPTDTASVLVNEAAVKALNLGPNPLGAEVNQGVHVIGVVRDFNYETLHKEVGPLVLQYSKKGYYVVAKVSPEATESFLKTAGANWQSLAPDKPFTYYFLDENLAEMSKQEAVLGKAILFFTLIAVMIACLGLFGLAAFTAGQRSKEIGIRKVLGATIGQITTLLTWEFLQLVLIAIVLATPFACWALQKWLRGFAFRTDLPWWIVLAAGIIALCIAALTITVQSIRAALSNPVEKLRAE